MTPPAIEVGGSLDVVPSVFTAPALPAAFIDMKGNKMRAKRDHATLRHSDAATPPSERGESSSSKRRRILDLMRDDCAEFSRDQVQRCGDVGTPACYGYPPSFPRQNQVQEAEGELTIPSGDQCEISTFEIKEAPSLESPLRNNVFNSYPSAGIHAQSSDTDEKPEDWPASLLTELDCVRDNLVARSPRWEEAGSPFVNGRVSSPTARSATLESTFESCETTLPTSTDSALEPDVEPTSSDVGASWTVTADAQYGRSLPSEEEANKLIDNEATESEGTRPLQAAAHLSNPRRGDVPGLVAVARPAAAILRALGPPRGTYAFEHLYTGPPSYQSSLSIAPTFQPQSQEAFASSAVCVLRGPSTIQHHGFPAVPDPLNKIDNTNPPPLILPPAAAYPPPDPVVRFLEELGLSPSLADSLRRVGISDDNRIRAIGALPRGPMDRIEKGLEAEGHALKPPVRGMDVDGADNWNAVAYQPSSLPHHQHGPAFDIQGRVHRRTRHPVMHHHHGISNHPSLTTGTAVIICIPRRPPSARLRGIPAPYVRASLSPDRDLRRRERRRRHPASIHADIEISSDSEVEHPPTRRASSRHPTPSVSHIPEVIDLTRLPSTPPPELCPSPSGSSASLDPNDDFLGINRDNQQDTTSICTYPVSSGRRPLWLRAAMGQLYSGHKGVQCEVRCDSEDTRSRFKTPTSWFIKCQECDKEKTMIIPAGPGSTIANFVQHVDSVHPHFRSALPRGESG